jgi:hypothetical protein
MRGQPRDSDDSVNDNLHGAKHACRDAASISGSPSSLITTRDRGIRWLIPGLLALGLAVSIGSCTPDMPTSSTIGGPEGATTGEGDINALMNADPPTDTPTPTPDGGVSGIGRPGRPAIIGNVLYGDRCDQAPASPGTISVELYRESTADADALCTDDDVQGDPWATTSPDANGAITFPSAAATPPETDWPPPPDNYCIRVIAPGSGSTTIEELLLAEADRDGTIDVPAGDICLDQP